MKKSTSVAVDILSHKLNPEMKVLSAAEKTKVLKRCEVNETQVPKFLSTDQVVVALKAVPGDLIRIERNDGTGKHVGYRIVIEV